MEAVLSLIQFVFQVIQVDLREAPLIWGFGESDLEYPTAASSRAEFWSLLASDDISGTSL
jgi:hypothetical protein